MLLIVSVILLVGYEEVGISSLRRKLGFGCFVLPFWENPKFGDLVMLIRYLNKYELMIGIGCDFLNRIGMASYQMGFACHKLMGVF